MSVNKLASTRKIISPIFLGAAAGIGIAWLVRRKRSQPVQALSNFRRFLAKKYGGVKGQSLYAAILQRYNELLHQRQLPDHPKLRWHLVENILPGLALYQVFLQENGNDRQAALLEVDEVFRSWTIHINRPVMAPLKLLPDAYPLFLRVFDRRMQIYPREGWNFEFVEKSSNRVAFNNTRCFYLQNLTAYGAPELTPAFCKIDEVMAELFPPSIRFTRTMTLARGDAVCDFQYCHGRPFQSSKLYQNIGRIKTEALAKFF